MRRVTTTSLNLSPYNLSSAKSGVAAVNSSRLLHAASPNLRCGILRGVELNKAIVDNPSSNMSSRVAFTKVIVKTEVCLVFFLVIG